MRTSMVYPNIITDLPPTKATTARDLPDLTRLKIRDRDHDGDDKRRSRSRRRSRSHDRERSRHNRARHHRDHSEDHHRYRSSRSTPRYDYHHHHHRSARTTPRSTPLHSPNARTKFFDDYSPPESAVDRSRSGRRSDRRSYAPPAVAIDASPIALGESAKDTARRIYHDRHRQYYQQHVRGDSSSSNASFVMGGVAGGGSWSRGTSPAVSPAAVYNPANPFDRLKPSGGISSASTTAAAVAAAVKKRPGLERAGYSADMFVRRNPGGMMMPPPPPPPTPGLASLAEVSDAGETTVGADVVSPLVPEDARRGHRRWHSKG